MLPEILSVTLILSAATVGIAFGDTRYYSVSAAADLFLGVTPTVVGAVVAARALTTPVSTGLFIAGECLFGVLMVLTLFPRPPSWFPSPSTTAAAVPVALLLVLSAFVALPAPTGHREPEAVGIILTVLSLFYFSVARRPGHTLMI